MPNRTSYAERQRLAKMNMNTDNPTMFKKSAEGTSIIVYAHMVSIIKATPTAIMAEQRDTVLAMSLSIILRECESRRIGVLP